MLTQIGAIPTHAHTNFQHVSAGPRPIFGLAVACGDWAQIYLSADRPDGTCGATPALEGGDEMRQDKVRMNYFIKIR